MKTRKLALAAAQAALSTFTIPAAAHAATLGGTLAMSILNTPGPLSDAAFFLVLCGLYLCGLGSGAALDHVLRACGQ